MLTSHGKKFKKWHLLKSKSLLGIEILGQNVAQCHKLLGKFKLTPPGDTGRKAATNELTMPRVVVTKCSFNCPALVTGY